MRPPFENDHYRQPVLSILRGEAPAALPPTFDARWDVVALAPLLEHLSGNGSARPRPGTPP